MKLLKSINPNINPIEIKIESNTINMHCTLSTNYAIEFDSKLNDILDFTKKSLLSG